MPGTAPRRTTNRIVFALGATLAVFAVACSFALNFNGIDDGVRDGSPPGTLNDADLADGGSPPSTDATTDTRLSSDAPLSVDAPSRADAPGIADAADAADTAVPCIPGPCGCHPGPAMVPIEDASFCIDSTEVTVAQYIDFLVAKGGDTSGQDEICSFNTTLVPGDPWPPDGSADQPIVRVSWCQAQFYCEWAGKHLCGSPDGTTGDPNSPNDPTQSLWFNVCTHNNDGLHQFPYGDTYEPLTCNGADYGAGVPLPSLSSCQGGYPGVYDVSGNVFEWEDRCFTEDAGPAFDFCYIRGGAFDQPEQFMECDQAYEVQRGDTQSANTGIRCCLVDPPGN